LHLAQQITLREQTYFHKIALSEFYCKAWDTPAKATNLVTFIDRFEKMKLMIASSIVESSKVSQRQAASALSYWLHVMAVCNSCLLLPLSSFLLPPTKWLLLPIIV
jgi:hypothetical protein